MFLCVYKVELLTTALGWKEWTWHPLSNSLMGVIVSPLLECRICHGVRNCQDGNTYQ